MRFRDAAGAEGACARVGSLQGMGPKGQSSGWSVSRKDAGCAALHPRTGGAWVRRIAAAAWALTLPAHRGAGPLPLPRRGGREVWRARGFGAGGKRCALSGYDGTEGQAQSRVEIGRAQGHNAGMNGDRPEAPGYWVEELARSDAERARGERVAANVVHDDMLRALAELEAEGVEADRGPARKSRGR